MLGFAKQDYVDEGFMSISGEVKQLAEIVEKRKNDTKILTDSIVELREKISKIEQPKKNTEISEIKDVIFRLFSLVEKLVREPPKPKTPSEEIAEIRSEFEGHNQEAALQKQNSVTGNSGHEINPVMEENLKEFSVVKNSHDDSPPLPDIKSFYGYCLSCKMLKKILNPERVKNSKWDIMRGPCETCKTMLITREVK